MTERVDIGGIILDAEKVVEIEHSTDVMKHPTEEGFSISDHLIAHPRKIRVDAVLFGSGRYGDYNDLVGKMGVGKPFDFGSPLGIIPNCVLTHISPRQEDSENCLSCTLELAEIKMATVSITTITPIEDFVTGIQISTAISGSTVTTIAEAESTLVKEAVPEEPTADESWTDNIWDGITSTATAISEKLFGWLK